MKHMQWNAYGKIMTSPDTKHLLNQLIEGLQNTTKYKSTQLFLVLTARPSTETITHWG